MEIRLKLQPLTAEAFASYGDVIEISETNEKLEINYGQTTRHHAISKVDVSDAGGEPVISLFRSKPVNLPFQLQVMERHPLGSQSFIPTGCNPYIVVVAGSGKFEPANMKAFLARPGQGVNYYKGVWHHYNLVLNGGGDFVVVDRDGPGNNCEEVQIPANTQVTVDR